MRRHSPIVVAALLALPGCVDTSQESASVEVAIEAPVITLLHVNDTHSHLAAWGPKDENLDGTLGGLAKASAVIASEKAVAPDALLVHAGDLFHGDLFFNEYLGVPELQLLQSLGLDVFVPGNHEFQFGPELLLGVLSSAWPPGGVSIVGTNLDTTGFPPLGLWIESTAIKEVGGVTVGFFGLTTPSDPLQIPEPVVIDPDLVGVSTRAVAELQAQGAEVIVGVAHVGLSVSRQLAEAVPGIDVIVNGHDHVALPEPEMVGGTLVVSAGEYYRWVGRLRMAFEGDHVSLVDYALLDVDADVAPLPPVQAIVSSLEAGIVARYGDVYHQVIGWAEEPVPDAWDPRKNKRDTAIGNLFTDAYRGWTGTDLALEASGFLDQGLPAGPIVPADVYRAMGYGLPVPDPDLGRYVVAPFRLATFTITGAELLEGLEVALAGPGDLFPQVSGMRLQIDSTQAPGQRVLVDTVRIGGRLLALDGRYTVTANEGLVMFLPMLGVEIEDATTLPETAVAAAQALIEARGVIDGGTSGRIRDVADRGGP